jgi:Putative peptidoglycan binding domain
MRWTRSLLMSALFFASSAILPAPTWGADAKGDFALHGIGAQTCEAVGKQMEIASANPRPLLTSWLLGYLSAMNRLQPDTYDVSPVQAPEVLTDMVLGICKGNGAALVEAVASAVFQQLSRARLKHDSPLLEVRAGDLATTLRRETLIAVQAALVKSKLMSSASSGEFDEPTKAALLGFQKAQQLRETSLPDPATIVRLLVELPQQASAPQPPPTGPAAPTPGGQRPRAR